MEFNIIGKVQADTSEFKNEINKLGQNDVSIATSSQMPSNFLELDNIYKLQNDAMKDMSFQIATVNQQFENSITALQSFAQTLNNISPFDNTKPTNLESNYDSDSSKKALFDEFENILPTMVYNFKQLSDSITDVKRDLPKAKSILPSIDKDKNQELLDQYAQKNLINFFSGSKQIMSNVINGNVGGGVVNAFNNTANALGNASKIADLSGAAGFAKDILKFVPGMIIAGLVTEGAVQLNDKYRESESVINNTGKSFRFDGDEDTSFDLYKKVNDYNVGTGLKNDEFNEYVQTLAKQGVADVDIAGTSTRDALRWAYATNGDESQFVNLAGKMLRYGGSSNINKDMSYLYGAAKASGLQDTQMGEFLRGIESVMEDGIAKGFTRSAKDVADTMVMFSKLSNNDKFWEGERGAQRINQINNGIANATNLSSTAHVMTLQAFSSLYGNDEEKRKADLGKDYIENGGYLNDMLLMEKGLNANVFDSLMKTLDRRTGGDIQAKAEYLKDITGFNYTGVSKLLQLQNEGLSQEELESAIKELQNDPINNNLETRMLQALNKIDETAKEAGKGVAKLSTASLEPIANSVDAIKNFLIKPDEEPFVLTPLDEAEETIEEVFKTPVDEPANEEEAMEWAGNEIVGNVESIRKGLKNKRKELPRAMNFLTENYGEELAGITNVQLKQLLDDNKRWGNKDGNDYLDRLVNITADGQIVVREVAEIVTLIREMKDKLNSIQVTEER